ncbi:fumarylacetoacetate hydrolase family protein [Arthrobacter sp. B2a2-09]|uniref:fumarylacetoacetate hydrolase family protein n=1 Tax=Arthrobacter sp. B2a2-09 TaxID=2952822 RepID=UPI0022CD8F60|nr:fumarylacetoacetate hydrolase family protein [Arthrobacter sp. B2a2-09]MCZ9880963.1 fumarylacetoacetate hydrolase family protein [Arthrobacter sp. B2a2-09]
MKLMRIGPKGQERPAVLVEGRVLDVASHVVDFDRTFFEEDGLGLLREMIAAGQLAELDVRGRRIGAPVARPGQIFCIGINYADHASESSLTIPPEPLVFGKSAHTVVGPNDDVHLPRGSTKTDWEVEIGVIIGRRARYLGSPEDALDCIAGLAISHDVSEREWQLERHGQWIKGKSFETFNPLGPWLVTLDEIADLGALTLELDVNGEARQRGSSKDMVFDIPYLIYYLSQFTVLEPGDLINTGTPAGVGLGMAPPQYLKANDVVDLRIGGLGAQRQSIVPAP